jgi:beta-xylosidase
MRHKAKNLTSCKALCLALLAVLYATTGWSVQCQTGDLGNGRYRNPILFADYSDPDVLGVGADYYMVASTFHYMPGIPVLHSTDLVNWDIVAHVFPRLDIDHGPNLSRSSQDPASKTLVPSGTMMAAPISCTQSLEQAP